MKGIAEMEFILDRIEKLELNAELELDLTLARGLNYYTGAIFEVKALDVQIGSITGGGRYDNLTGVFGMDGVSGVGISFGADRHLRCLEPAGTLSRRFFEDHATAVRELRRERRKLFVASDLESACCRYPYGVVSRSCQNEKTDGICRYEEDSVCGDCR